jgi:hypothetical protein
MERHTLNKIQDVYEPVTCIKCHLEVQNKLISVQMTLYFSMLCYAMLCYAKILIHKPERIKLLQENTIL